MHATSALFNARLSACLVSTLLISCLSTDALIKVLTVARMSSVLLCCAALRCALLCCAGHPQALAFAGGLVQRFPWIRDRMIFDDKYLFKVLAECVIDCGELACLCILRWRWSAWNPAILPLATGCTGVLWVCLLVCVGMTYRWHLPLGMVAPCALHVLCKTGV